MATAQSNLMRCLALYCFSRRQGEFRAVLLRRSCLQL